MRHKNAPYKCCVFALPVIRTGRKTRQLWDSFQTGFVHCHSIIRERIQRGIIAIGNLSHSSISRTLRNFFLLATVFWKEKWAKYFKHGLFPCAGRSLKGQRRILVSVNSKVSFASNGILVQKSSLSFMGPIFWKLYLSFGILLKGPWKYFLVQPWCDDKKKQKKLDCVSACVQIR